MASLTIRNLNEETKQRLRLRAAEKGVSMEAEAREILRDAVAEPPHESGAEWYRRFRAIIEEAGGFDDLIEHIPDRHAEDTASTSRRLPFVGDPEFDDSVRRDAS